MGQITDRLVADDPLRFDIDPAERNLRPGHRSLKQFQNVPRAHIEMLLPSVQVRMRPIDTLVVGVPALVLLLGGDRSGQMRVPELDDALVILDRRWDDLFRYA